MFKKFIASFVLLSMSFACYGLADTAAPTKIQIPFANGAGGAYVRTVPIPSQIGIINGAASYTDGFPPLNFTPVNAGGVPPFGQDMNGILRDVSAHARWWAAGGPVYYDGTYQTAIGGYPKGAIVQSAVTTGLMWVSTTENNVTNPDTGGAGWTHPDSTIYAPLNGTGATGTWNINVTGNLSGTIGSLVTGTTQSVGDNSTKIATTAFVQSAIASQTLQNVTASRAESTTYTNNTSAIIWVIVKAGGGTSSNLAGYVNGAVVAQQFSSGTSMFAMSITFPVPPGSTYMVFASGTLGTGTWYELR